jgi:hypothetical protein
MIRPVFDRETIRGGPGIRVLPLVLALLAGCATEGVDVTTTSAVASTTASTGIIVTSTTSSLPSTTTTVPVDASAAVTASLAASSANYRFSSVVLVGEQTVTTMTGVVDGGSVSANIATGTSEVSYVRTQEGEWVTESDGDWVALEGEPPVGAPLDALADAEALALESGDADQGVFTGVLGPAAGAVRGVAFTVTVEGGRVTEVRYQVDTGGELAQVITTFSDFGVAGTVSKPEGV